jgi:hypothetical protein
MSNGYFGDYFGYYFGDYFGVQEGGVEPPVVIPSVQASMTEEESLENVTTICPIQDTEVLFKDMSIILDVINIKKIRDDLFMEVDAENILSSMTARDLKWLKSMVILNPRMNIITKMKVFRFLNPYIINYINMGSD